MYSCKTHVNANLVALTWPAAFLSADTAHSADSDTSSFAVSIVLKIVSGLTGWTVTFRSEPARSDDIRLQSDFLRFSKQVQIQDHQVCYRSSQVSHNISLGYKRIWRHKQIKCIKNHLIINTRCCCVTYTALYSLMLRKVCGKNFKSSILVKNISVWNNFRWKNREWRISSKSSILAPAERTAQRRSKTKKGIFSRHQDNSELLFSNFKRENVLLFKRSSVSKFPC